MLNGTMLSTALGIISLVVMIIFIWKLFSSSRELSKLKEIEGSEVIFRSVITSIAVIVIGVALNGIYADSVIVVYVDSIVGLTSSFTLLYGAIGFTRIVKYLKNEG